MSKPTQFGSKRAAAIFAQRGMEWNLDASDMTEGERAYVKQVWESMPGNTSWNDAFLRILNGRVPCPNKAD